MKVGITGSNGFIGFNILSYLKGQKVKAIPIDLRKIEKNKKNNIPNDFNWILHFAARTEIPKSLIEVDKVYSNNIISTSKALSIAKDCNSSFLFLSSYVYGKPNYLPIDEKHKVDPGNSYINSKLICEKLCKDQLGSSDRSLVILRCFNIYGFGLKTGRLIYDIMYSALHSRNIIINDPIPRRDYLYIEDFCTLIKKIIRHKKVINQTFNVGSGKSYSNYEIAKIVKSLSDDCLKIKVMNNPRDNDLLEIRADISSINEIYNWLPKIDIINGLKNTLQKSTESIL